MITERRALETLRTWALRSAESAEREAELARADLDRASDRFGRSLADARTTRQLAEAIEDRLEALDDDTVDADDLDHTKPNPIDRAQRRYEGIDAPAPGVDDRADPLAHVVPGEIDVTTDDHDTACERENEGGVGVCTRDFGHPGHHIAGDGHEVIAVWRDDV